MSEPETWLGNIQRLIDAFARGEVTRGGMAEAGWRDIGTVKGDGPVFVRSACLGCGLPLPHAAGECLRGDR